MQNWSWYKGSTLRCCQQHELLRPPNSISNSQLHLKLKLKQCNLKIDPKFPNNRQNSLHNVQNIPVNSSRNNKLIINRPLIPKHPIHNLHNNWATRIFRSDSLHNKKIPQKIELKIDQPHKQIFVIAIDCDQEQSECEKVCGRFLWFLEI